ncbi:hypothetical protein GWK47_026402 [Chionoecetes opilio]|uniref:Uncharacterized protein n=1 Tax=Chionoecetes opilio TaxID=41210 RepID=A0A8J8WNI7_CHIOP|nr:hypothetical protein GWK47_026402 [Chionoecetes opilio]
MRFILGCPLSTRIINKQSELALPPLVQKIYANVTYFSVKCLHSPYPAPHFSAVIRTSLDPDSHFDLVATTSSMQCATTFVALILLSPRRQLCLANHRDGFLSLLSHLHSKDVPPLLQKQLALETIGGVSTSVPAAPHIYVVGSV